ncbi:Tigger transposable element-derived protein 4 [Clonorchis sinensis]|uniref:Tigger transposable element-derived protein 4 n=1 Tax=Clonorchis sinensis TaxID=79923 RepID=A0A8T1MAI1_CLOSI|nr:Tigger transposable element-derived protein 4 [Clonorchis sinensis]
MAPIRKAISVGQKQAILKAYEALNRVSQREAVRILRQQGFEISQPCLSQILKDKESLRLCTNPEALRNRGCKFKELESTLVDWICDVKSQGVRVSKNLIKVKAESLKNSMGLSSFKCSDGWLEKFERRHKLRLQKHPDNPDAIEAVDKGEWLKTSWTEGDGASYCVDSTKDTNYEDRQCDASNQRTEEGSSATNSPLNSNTTTVPNGVRPGIQTLCYPTQNGER